MYLFERVKGLILSPQTEWETIQTETTSIPDLYRSYIAILATLPPFASFLGGWLYGYPHTPAHPTFAGGLMRAVTQYVLSLPALYLVAFVISMAAPHFDGRSNDRRALQLVAYSYTPFWIAALFGLVPGLRWLDVLGFYGIYIFSLGLPRMLRIPRENADVFTLLVLVLTIATAALHGWIVHFIAPLEVG